MQAGQTLLQAFNKAELTTAERSHYHDDLKAEHEKVKLLKTSLKTAKARAANLEKEIDEAADKAKKAERELGKVLRRERRKMEVDRKAFQAGFDRAGAEYIRQARKMVNDQVEVRVPIAYRRGYKDEVAAAFSVLQLEADMNLTKSIPAPVVPKLEISYTEAECALLPPEEYPESDDDVEDVSGDGTEDATRAKSNAEDATNVEQDVATNVEAENVEKN